MAPLDWQAFQSEPGIDDVRAALSRLLQGQVTVRAGTPARRPGTAGAGGPAAARGGPVPVVSDPGTGPVLAPGP